MREEKLNRILGWLNFYHRANIAMLITLSWLGRDSLLIVWYTSTICNYALAPPLVTLPNFPNPPPPQIHKIHPIQLAHVLF